MFQLIDVRPLGNGWHLALKLRERSEELFAVTDAYKEDTPPYLWPTGWRIIHTPFDAPYLLPTATGTVEIWPKQRGFLCLHYRVGWSRKEKAVVIFDGKEGD